jgi:hypothetical protein
MDDVTAAIIHGGGWFAGDQGARRERNPGTTLPRGRCVCQHQRPAGGEAGVSRVADSFYVKCDISVRKNRRHCLPASDPSADAGQARRWRDSIAFRNLSSTPTSPSEETHMAKRKTAGKSRSQHVRDYLASNPSATPNQIVEALKAKGIEVGVGLAGSVK